MSVLLAGVMCLAFLSSASYFCSGCWSGLLLVSRCHDNFQMTIKELTNDPVRHWNLLMVVFSVKKTAITKFSLNTQHDSLGSGPNLVVQWPFPLWLLYQVQVAYGDTDPPVVWGHSLFSQNKSKTYWKKKNQSPKQNMHTKMQVTTRLTLPKHLC